MTAYLLDANVLIALTVAEHEHHARASDWMAGIDRFALCPGVEGALVRFLVRIGERASVATTLLRHVHALRGCESGRTGSPTPTRISTTSAAIGR